MAAAIKAINARIRANPYLDYFCSTRESAPYDPPGPIGVEKNCLHCFQFLSLQLTLSILLRHATRTQCRAFSEQ
jgi:hypothetical protein